MIANVDNLLYGGRTLVGSTDEGERIAGWPEVAYEAIRAINHLTGPVAEQRMKDIATRMDEAFAAAQGIAAAAEDEDGRIGTGE